MQSTDLQPDQIWRQLSRYTMVKYHRYITNLQLAQHARNIPGTIVECGVWRGGMIAGIAKTLGPQRDYWLFDSFEGLPEAQPIDGAKAATLTGTCRADEHHAREAMQIAGITDYHIVKGWFEDTLPATQFPDGIALLRLDGDWYDSTLTCLNYLFPQVNPNGIIIIDDYYVWPGCARALHEYLANNQRTEPIRQAGPSHPAGRCVCWLRKEEQP